MKKRVILLFCILFLLQSVSAEWFFDSTEAILDLNISSKILITSTTGTSDIDYIEANVSFFPYNTPDQDVLELDAAPKPKYQQNAAIFRWDNPADEVKFQISSRIKRSNIPVRVTQKIRFPLA